MFITFITIEGSVPLSSVNQTVAYIHNFNQIDHVKRVVICALHALPLGNSSQKYVWIMKSTILLTSSREIVTADSTL